MRPAALPARILIVDDDHDAAWSLAALIRHELDCEVRAAGGGAEAIDQASDMRPDVIVVDISMPGIDGTEVARLVHEIFRPAAAPRLIAVSGYYTQSDRQRILDSGFDAYLPKPVDFDVLMPLLRRAA